MATGAIVARILTQYSDKGSKQAQKDINKLGANFDKFAKKSFQAFAIASAAAAAFAVKLGVDAVRGAMEDEKQQLALATALRNVTGATDEAIAATVKYLDAKELSVGVDNNQLIPSLQILTQATRDVTQAQLLQNLALDISAGTSKDLGAVSLALAKALGGNVGALTRLGVPLDAAAVKSKDLNAILQSLGETFAGQAAKRAETFEFRLMRLQLAFNQVLDQIGYAFIPVLDELAQNLLTNVIPALQKWVDENKEGLVKSLQNAATFIKTLLERAIAFGQWVTDNTGKVKALAIIIGTMFVADKIAGFVIALKTITAAMAALRATAIGTAIATAFATGGISVGAAAAALAAAGIATVGLAFVKKQMDNSNDETAKSTSNLNKNSDIYRRTVGKTTTAVTKLNIANTTTTKKTKELSAEQLKAIEVQKKLNAQFGVTTKEDDPVQLEAARLNLVKQQALAIEAVGNAQWAFLEAQLATNTQAQRYADILAVINDNKISTAEVQALALKWGISSSAVLVYIKDVTGINNIVINKDLGAEAAKGWDLAKKNLEDYLKMAGANTQFSPATVTAIAETDAATAAALAAAEEAIKVSEGIDAFLKSLNLPVVPTISTPFGQAGSSAASALGTPFGQAGSTINVTVNAGSVVGSTDALISTVREGILAGQSSGNVISYNPLDI
jgi:hypothetical protein